MTSTGSVVVVLTRMASLRAVIAGNPRRLDFSSLITYTGCVVVLPLHRIFPRIVQCSLVVVVTVHRVTSWEVRTWVSVGLCMSP